MRKAGEISERGRVKYAFLFTRFAITVQQWAEHAAEGVERGARVEIQRVEERPTGTEFACVPTLLAEPIWRGDFFALIPGPSGNFERAHFHPTFTGFEPSDRHWAPEIKLDPVSWLAATLDSGLDQVFEASGANDLVGGEELADVRAVLPEILTATRRCLSAEDLNSK